MTINNSKSRSKSSKGIHIFVDGSYHETEGAGYGWVAFDASKKNIIGLSAEPVYNPLYQSSTCAELIAAIRALKWAQSQNINKVNLHYDFVGIKDYTIRREREYSHPLYQEYNEFIVGLSGITQVFFHKVAAHSGHFGNELADSLAHTGRKKGIKRSWLQLIKGHWIAFSFKIGFNSHR